jgi:hypothetical protein
VHFRFILIALCLFPGQVTEAQKLLLIEKAGNPRTEKIAMYDELTFQLHDDEAGWYTRQILDMDVNGQLILLGNSWVAIKDISRIKLKRQRAVANILGGALQVGGIAMFFNDVWFTINGRPEYSEDGMQFGLINFAVGTGIRMLWAPIKFRLGKQTRLRVVDLTF